MTPEVETFNIQHSRTLYLTTLAGIPRTAGITCFCERSNAKPRLVFLSFSFLIFSARRGGGGCLHDRNYETLGSMHDENQFTDVKGCRHTGRARSVVDLIWAVLLNDSRLCRVLVLPLQLSHISLTNHQGRETYLRPQHEAVQSCLSRFSGAGTTRQGICV
jgi:hypothetical protein